MVIARGRRGLAKGGSTIGQRGRGPLGRPIVRAKYVPAGSRPRTTNRESCFSPTRDGREIAPCRRSRPSMSDAAACGTQRLSAGGAAHASLEGMLTGCSDLRIDGTGTRARLTGCVCPWELVALRGSVQGHAQRRHMHGSGSRTRTRGVADKCVQRSGRGSASGKRALRSPQRSRRDARGPPVNGALSMYSTPDVEAVSDPRRMRAY